jgi:hypothetical protein
MKNYTSVGERYQVIVGSGGLDSRFFCWTEREVRRFAREESVRERARVFAPVGEGSGLVATYQGGKVSR